MRFSFVAPTALFSDYEFVLPLTWDLRPRLYAFATLLRALNQLPLVCRHFKPNAKMLARPADDVVIIPQAPAGVTER